MSQHFPHVARTLAAAVVITNHRSRPQGCECGKQWSPLHVAEELEKADLLCALKTAAGPGRLVGYGNTSSS